VGTLFLVPTIYFLLKKQPPIDYSQEIEEEYHEGDEPKNKPHGSTQEQPA
jgi:hypothetical protein